MNHYIIPLQQNDPRLFTHMSQAYSLVDLGKRLLDAAKNGDVEEVRNLMNSGAPFTTDWLGISPLHFACMNGHLSTCEALLRAGISRDARTKVDRTPLHLAAQEGHADIVELLLKSGADLEALDMLQMTALHWAAERGHAHVVAVLMKYGANPKRNNKFEMTPLEIALQKNHKEAYEAMQNPCRDNLSNGDASGYILTEEETLVPAASPVDEVVVTSVEEDATETQNDSEPVAEEVAPPQQLSGQIVNLEDGRSAIVVTGSEYENGYSVFNTDGSPASATLARDAISAFTQQSQPAEEPLILDQLRMVLEDESSGGLQVAGLSPDMTISEVCDWLLKQGLPAFEMDDGCSLLVTLEHGGQVCHISGVFSDGTLTFQPLKGSNVKQECT